MKSVVITGVSTGIGWSSAKFLLQKGYRVFGSVRKQEDAERLTREFGGNFIPLIFDVTDEAAVQAAAQTVREQLQGETLFGLVNNAGIAIAAPLIHMPTDEFRHQIEVNLVSVLIVTKAFAPLLGADRSLRGEPGRIINMSSVGGKRGSPFLGPYVTSKHGLEGFSETLRRELILYGIDVIIIGPGPIATPIWDKAEQANASTQYQDTDYYEAGLKVERYMVKQGKKGLPPETVAEIVWTALTSPNPRVRYAIEPGNPIRNFIQSLLPKRTLDSIIAKNLGFKK
ncbi:MAG TPA: SDR family NAD(P)-dependent oxidoreductase [Anaerolineales bacterium]|nr:SDR family NAD(P)-dependent oxidoreductase [Anaerolineales bacterium]HNA90090.1 SDR family NAD(P)-dependent oxidoreductase [Anaerolineales bacterium]HNB37442.1 SDR family NAD(P)-dependent oxidoreductase [Anaerolineales bacterium]HNC09826.1 SDR family NAD(P)-dependent oxidoreductase [Anaerolineales bacterium]